MSPGAPGNICPSCGSEDVALGEGVGAALEADERECRVCLTQWVVRNDGTLYFVYHFGGVGGRP